MQAPKKKTSKSRRGTRRAHDALVPKWISECPNCKEQIRSFSICMSCGTYRGRVLMPELAENKKSA